MRVSFNSSYDKFLTSNARTQDALSTISKQLSSGKKIEFGQEAPSVYVDALRLDYEITTFIQTKDISNKAKSFSDYTDSALNEFSSNLETFKTKLLAAGNDIHSVESRGAIVKDLEAIREHLKNLANTSINGQYIFSGSSLSTQPISSDYSYQGNDKRLNALVGSSTQIDYNMDGYTLFLGQDSDFNKKITTNARYGLGLGNEIQDLVGANSDEPTYFYIRGTKPNGDTFKDKFSLDSADTINDLLEKIEESYGNTTTNKIVTASLNEWGQIEIMDNTTGRAKLDLHLVAATDLSGGTGANVDDISTLNGLSIGDATDLTNGDISQYNGVIVTGFMASGSDAKLTDGSIDYYGISYDKVRFKKSDLYLTSNVSQVITSTNKYADATTKISDVAGDLTNKNTSFVLDGLDIDGNAVNVTIDLTSLSASTPNNSVNEVTYQQLLNEIAINLSGESDIEIARGKVDVTMDEKGRVRVRDLTTATTTKMELAIYDSNTDNFIETQDSTLRFNSNNALVIVEPSTDFFAQLDEAIDAVKYGLYRAYSGSEYATRNIGLQNSISSIDHLMKHVEKIHTEVGAQNRSIMYSIERQETMLVHAKTLKSEILDTDIAESTLNLNQLSLNYQAMMTAISKINSLSLVNYLK